MPWSVVDDDDRLVGLVTKNDIGSIGLGDTELGKGLLSHTSVENIAKAINGTIVYDDAENHLNGMVSFIAQTSDASLERYDIHDECAAAGHTKRRGHAHSCLDEQHRR